MKRFISSTRNTFSEHASTDRIADKFEDIREKLGSKMSWPGGVGVGTVFFGGTWAFVRYEAAKIEKGQSDIMEGQNAIKEELAKLNFKIDSLNKNSK